MVIFPAYVIIYSMRKYAIKTFAGALALASLLFFSCDASGRRKSEYGVPFLKGTGIVKMDKFAVEQVKAMKTANRGDRPLLKNIYVFACKGFVHASYRTELSAH